MVHYSSLDQLAAGWRDEPDYHVETVASFTAAVNADAQLRAHRDFVQQHALGCGDQSFHWLWHLAFEDWRARYVGSLTDLLPTYRFLEIGVFRGQSISLMQLLAQRAQVETSIVGVSAFDARGMLWPQQAPEYDDEPHVRWLFELFQLEPPQLIRGDCADPRIVNDVHALGLFDAVYIDASHDYDAVVADLQHYAPLVKPGGLLFGDDSACYLHLPVNYFCGFEGCSRAFDELISRDEGTWTHLGNVMHLRVWRRT